MYEFKTRRNYGRIKNTYMNKVMSKFLLGCAQSKEIDACRKYDKRYIYYEIGKYFCKSGEYGPTFNQ